MRDFDDKALILLPNKELYDEGSSRWRYQMQTAATNMVAYLRSIEMEPHAFLTDDLAMELPNFDVRYVNTLTRGDLFFVTNNCDIPKDALRWNLVEYPDIVNAIAEKDPVNPKASVEERFAQILAHDKKAITSIIPMYKVVVNFYRKSNTRYRVVIKQNGGKIRLVVDTFSFKVDAYINNLKEDPIDLLGADFGNRSILNWEV